MTRTVFICHSRVGARHLLAAHLHPLDFDEQIPAGLPCHLPEILLDAVETRQLILPFVVRGNTVSDRFQGVRSGAARIHAEEKAAIPRQRGTIAAIPAYRRRPTAGSIP
jgi:hypothetical protein